MLCSYNFMAGRPSHLTLHPYILVYFFKYFAAFFKIFTSDEKLIEGRGGLCNNDYSK